MNFKSKKHEQSSQLNLTHNKSTLLICRNQKLKIKIKQKQKLNKLQSFTKNIL